MPRKKKNTYSTMPGACFPEGEAQSIGVELERIHTKFGVVKAQDVVNESTSKKSALHHLFEWDNDKAGNEWRCQQARTIIRSVRIIEPDLPKQEQHVIRGFVNVTASDTETQFEGRGYMKMGKVIQRDEYRQQVLDKAKAELRQWEHRYKDYKDFFGQVFEAIEQLD